MMDVNIGRESLLPLLGRVVSVVERRQTLPILGNLLFEARNGVLTVVGTDLEVEIRSWTEADIVQEGEVTLPARKVLDICRSLPEGIGVRLKANGDRCTVTAGRGRYSLGTLPAQDFPRAEERGMDDVFEVEAGELRRVLDKTAFAMAQQDVRYYLNGLFVHVAQSGLTAVATDGHRLACYAHQGRFSVADDRSVIIPFKTITELRRQLGNDGTVVQVEVGDRLIRFVVAETVITSKLIDGRYPEYARVIPAGLSRRAVVDREGLRKALARTAILSNEKYRGVRLFFEPGVLRLVAHNPEQEEAVEEMELDYAGDSLAVGFNFGYLSDLLSAVDSEKVEVLFEDGNTSSLWRGAGVPSETYVVMPMRL